MATNQPTTENDILQPTNTQNTLSSQELFDQVLVKIQENLDKDVTSNNKTQDQASFILREITGYLKTYLQL